MGLERAIVGLLAWGMAACATRVGPVRVVEVARSAECGAAIDAATAPANPHETLGIQQLALVGELVCALYRSGEVRCAPDGSAGAAQAPHAVLPASLGVVAIAGNGQSLFVVTRDGNVGRVDAQRSRGAAAFGGLPIEPLRHWPGAHGFRSDNNALCAVLADGSTDCTSGPGGRGIRIGWNTVVDAGREPSLPDVVEIAPAGNATYALRTDGTVWAWGSGALFGLGEPFELGPAPRALPGLGDVASIAPGTLSHVCVRTHAGRVVCFGQDEAAHPGGTLTAQTQPARIDLEGVADVASGWSHACAIDGDGRVWCWGSDESGESSGRAVSPQCPRAMRSCAHMPMRVVAVVGAEQLAAGMHRTCALVRDGGVLCWGGAQRTVRGVDFVRSLGECVPRTLGQRGAVTLAVAGATTDTVEYCLDRDADVPGLSASGICFEVAANGVFHQRVQLLPRGQIDPAPVTIAPTDAGVRICIRNGAGERCHELDVPDVALAPTDSQVSNDGALFGEVRWEESSQRSHALVREVESGRVRFDVPARSSATFAFVGPFATVRDCAREPPETVIPGTSRELGCRRRFFDSRTGRALADRAEPSWDTLHFEVVADGVVAAFDRLGASVTWFAVPGRRELRRLSLDPRVLPVGDDPADLPRAAFVRLDATRVAIVHGGGLTPREREPMGGDVRIVDLAARTAGPLLAPPFCYDASAPTAHSSRWRAGRCRLRAR